ncbi:DUF6455 family protein [Primorskyibacter sp. 2E233]|uniref:DUF6455 family protein n=1 Tax=Primorskyibacter sp. 2E233 TaxID=3413431 RepID=UPI003BF45940
MTRDQADRRPYRPLGPERRHYWMAQRMAKATGVDLVEAMEEHALTQEDWSRIVTRCRGCEWVQGCKHWLAQGGDTIRDLPEGCANRARYAALRTVTEEADL